LIDENTQNIEPSSSGSSDVDVDISSSRNEEVKVSNTSS